MRSTLFLMILSLLPALASASAVNSPQAACELLKRAAKTQHFGNFDPPRGYYCDFTPDKSGHFVAGLHYFPTEDEKVGSTLIGWYAVRKKDGAVLSWDITKEMASEIPLTPRLSAPERVVQAFYRTPTGLGGVGLPNPEALQSIKPYISSTLAELLARARVAEQACIKQTPPGLKPPIWETAIFVGDFDAARRLAGMNVIELESMTSVIEASLHRGSSNESNSIVRVSLAYDRGRWAINDVQVAGEQPLSEALSTYAKDNACSFKDNH